MGDVPDHCGGIISGMEILGSIRKQAKQAMGNKPVSSTPRWRLHQHLPLGFCPVCVPVLASFSDRLHCGSVKPNKPPQLAFWSWCFAAAIETLVRTATRILVLELWIEYEMFPTTLCVEFPRLGAYCCGKFWNFYRGGLLGKVAHSLMGGLID